METARNEQLDLALSFVQFTNKNIFLTGKAGTGKTTFLHNLKKSSQKRMAVVAPTGVAAINAGGVTIHSFFQLPFGPYIPGNKSQPFKRFNRDKINLIRSLDLLVIDEISMVRADTLDGIDEVLRRYRDHSKPFGGVQLLMIGDLHQLSPVTRDDDWNILKDFYSNLYFFSSRALQKTELINIELKHIYRQADSTFIGLLNDVRNNKITQQVLDQLNKRYLPDFNPGDDEGYITLTTHNKTAQEINEQKLEGITTPSHRFKAVVQGDFPEFSYPTIFELEIKPGAQVMFVKNDPSRERIFYNGKIGRIQKIVNEVIYVKCPGESNEIAVEPLEWENIRYELNPDTKEVEEKKAGSFTQYPLKLAWAITIHKSQGLTFEKAIIDASAAFAHGQVYVALSRCKSFEGLVLRSPISSGSVKTDGTVDEYTRYADQNAPDETKLELSKAAYQQSLIYELFDFSTLKTRFYHCRKVAEDNINSLETSILNELNQIKEAVEKDIYTISDTFKKHLNIALSNSILPEQNTDLQEKIKKACSYFSGKIETLVSNPFKELIVDSDNKAVKASIDNTIAELLKEAFVKRYVLKTCVEGFSTIRYLQSKANAEIDFSGSKTTQRMSAGTRKDLQHPQLYEAIRSWRDAMAETNNLPVYMVLPQKTLIELLNQLPATLSEIESVKGMGKIKVKQYGDELLKIINTYCIDHGIERNPIERYHKPATAIRPDTKKVSFDLYKEGKTISEIAAERNFTTGTIEGHLSEFIGSGELSVFDIVTKVKVAKIMTHIIQNPKSSTSEIKTAMGDHISYGEIKAVMQHIAYVSTEAE